MLDPVSTPLRTRLSQAGFSDTFTNALMQQWNHETARRFLGNEQEQNRFLEAARNQSIITFLSPEDYREFAARTYVPLGKERAVSRGDFEQIWLTITEMELWTTLILVAEELMILAPKHEHESGGWFSNDGELLIRSNGNQRFRLPATLIHECGHGIEYYCMAHAHLRTYIEHYTVLCLLQPTYSVYAEAVGRKFGKTSRAYFQECFAEDFLAHVLKPSLLSKEKRYLMTHLIRIAFPTIRFRKIVIGTARVMEHTYGLTINDLFDTLTEDLVESYLEFFE